tara:strand:+ start:7275 stop:8237 length:963 start_codon:yes stop_codon:yes gene_type:complete
MKILITGCAGFIGFNLAKALLEKKNLVLGIDNYDDYYSTKLKKKRIMFLKNFKNFKFLKIDITNESLLKKNLEKKKIDIIFHFAAQAGVRYSLINPQKYIKSNLSGFCNLIESIKHTKPKKFIYASSSSVYGESRKFPLSEKQSIKPKNIYGMTKKFNEELAENYSKLYNINMIGLRFFTIFGEWGRPDMFVTKFLTSSFKKKPFYLNNHGNHVRDFTYIKDLIQILLKLQKIKLRKKHDIFNICSGKPINITRTIKYYSKKIYKPKIIMRPLQKADIIKTHGDNSKLKKSVGNLSFTKFENALDNTLAWYRKNKIEKIV